jgi:hypothetical protein
VGTFAALVKCVPFFGFFGIGLYLLLTAIFPSWRSKDWARWTVYRSAGLNDVADPNSWLVKLGWMKARKPLAQDEFDIAGAIWWYSCLGAICILIGAVGIVWIVLASR